VVFHNKLVAAIKVNGQVLREVSNVVTLPFGSEYSVLLKNLNSVRSLVKVSVDGQDATEGTWLIVPSNGSLELERFIRNGNFERGNRFKFIERTEAVEKHRGIGAEDGLVRVEFKMEHVRPVVDVPIRRYYDDWIPVPRPYYPPPQPRWPYDRRGTWSMSNRPMSRPSASAGSRPGQRKAMYATRSMGNIGEATASMDCAFSDTGITVPGSESTQKFVTGEYFPTEAQSEVIVLRLRGAIAGKIAVKAVTVNSKPTCSTCGKTSKGAAEFCAACGTALSLI
jgi:hypothetical protein